MILDFTSFKYINNKLLLIYNHNILFIPNSNDSIEKTIEKVVNEYIIFNISLMSNKLLRLIHLKFLL